MTNKEIARHFDELAKLMELQEENTFKIRSYQNAYRAIRALPEPLEKQSDEEIQSIKGVGKAIAAKIRELIRTGRMATLEKYRDQAPEGIREMLKIKGFGPKKIRVIWQELGLESPGELLYACNENRLIELKGFGAKTQKDLAEKIRYYLNARGKFHYATLIKAGLPVLEALRERLPDIRVEFTGAIRRKAIIGDKVEILIGTRKELQPVLEKLNVAFSSPSPGDGYLDAIHESGIPFRFYQCAPETFGSRQFRYTGSPSFIEAFLKQSLESDFRDLASEEEVFSKGGLPFVAPELRESGRYLSGKQPELIEARDIKGVLHAHSTYSDGLFSLEEMSRYVHSLGYEYFGISDHSRTAVYANGLKVEKVLQQAEEVRAINRKYPDFRIFHGIESDILTDGSLDYPEEILSQFDFVIASVHSVLKMDIEKATARLIAAIENPYTRILGHPTGRLLLSREGYPLHFEKVIDACAANGVAIELNANPYRLDLDWRWIPYAMDKGCLISINPDAHSKEGVHDLDYGIAAARKGGLTKESCLNAFSLSAFENWLEKGKS
jgi:DNA polymerase (family 10)